MKSIPKREVQMNQKEHQKENSGNAPQSKQSAVQNDAYDVEAGDARRNATVNQPRPAPTQNSQERRKTQQEWAKDVFQEVNDIFAEINYRLSAWKVTKWRDTRRGSKGRKNRYAND